MSLGESIRHGAKWVFIGNTGSQVINFALGLILARLLMPAEFGMVATILIYTNLAGFVAGGGMGQAIVRAKEASKRDFDLLFTLQALIGLVIVAFFFAIAPWFGRWYENPLYADMLRVAALSFLIRPFFNVPSNMLHRDMRFKAKTAVQLTNLVVYNSIALSMAYLDYGPVQPDSGRAIQLGDGAIQLPVTRVAHRGVFRLCPCRRTDALWLAGIQQQHHFLRARPAADLRAVAQLGTRCAWACSTRPKAWQPVRSISSQARYTKCCSGRWPRNMTTWTNPVICSSAA